MSAREQSFKAVIFDMDGTLFDSEILYFDSFNTALQEQKLSLAKEAYFIHLAGRTNSVAETYMLRTYGEKLDYQKFLQRWPEILHELTRLPIPMMPTIHELLKKLKQLNIPMAVGSSSDRPEIERFTITAGIRDYFSAIASGDEVKHGKPHPAIFLNAAERLGVKPEQCIVIEDSNAGVEAGKRAGMKVILAKTHLIPTNESLKHSIYTDDPRTITLKLLGHSLPSV